MKPAFVILVVTCTAMVGGCSPKPEVAATDELQDKIVALESKLAELSAQSSDESEALRLEISNLTDSNSLHLQRIASLEAMIEDQSNQILALTQTVDRARAYVEQLRSRQTSGVISQPDQARNSNSVRDDFIHPPVGANPDLYPVNIFNVVGKKNTSQEQERNTCRNLPR